MGLALKVCGMREAKNMEAVAALNPNYMGFIIYPKSPRFIGLDFDRGRLKNLPESIQKVGVFVNASAFEVMDFAMTFGFDLVQLHGDETPETCQMIKRAGIKVIKAFGVGESFDFLQLEAYEDAVDYFLFDTKTKAYGGSGERFDWSILKQYNNAKPIFLSGGLDENSAQELKKLSHLNIHAVDVNSRFETEPAVKDVEKLNVFFKALKA
ncbi:MAG: phosphoribosylanthranilate isomerase [Cytophagales bacterium]|nr:phosphoribosylanthranilate isomerase [Cytophagales bacterium]